MKNRVLEDKLKKSIDYLKTELSQIRTGRANPSLIGDIPVNVYESKMSVKELGNIQVKDPQNLIIIPWDKNLIPDIAKAIITSDMGLNPVEDKDKIRVPIPPLTEERRRELNKKVNIYVEEAKSSIRNIRQEAMKDIDKDFENKNISEDEKFRFKDQVEELVKEYSTKAEKIGEEKEKYLMAV